MKSPGHAALIERILPTTVVLAIVLIAFITLYPFLPAILWGAMMGIAIEPRYRRLTERLGGRKVLAAWLAGLVLGLLFVIPAVGLGRALLTFLPSALDWIDGFSLSVPSAPPGRLNELPAIGPTLAQFWHSLFQDTAGLASHFTNELKRVFLWVLAEVEILGIFVVEFAIGVILAAIFAYRADRISILASQFFDRIGGRFAQRMAAHAVLTTRQAVRGVLGAALAQTLVATFAYVIAGVPGWIIWAGITFIFSLVQVGPMIIWLPMSIWLWTEDRLLMAAFVFLWGLLVVNLTDNIVRPILVSKNSNFPAILAVLGAVGGLIEWGVVGVFLGPVIVAVCYELFLKWLEPDTLPDDSIR